MKTTYIALAFASISIVACNRGANQNTSATAASSANQAVKSGSAEQPDTAAGASTGKPAETASSANGAKTITAFKPLLNDYLALKNALIKDASNDAAKAGKTMADDFAKFDQSSLTAEQKKAYLEIVDDAKENAEHIGKSADRLPHQREHFDMLSKDMYDLVKLFGAGQKLYVDHCPMYNNNKGANWLSETKEIRNPYLGTKMSDCGAVKEELNGNETYN